MKKIITILSFAALLFSCAKPINQPEVKLNTYTIEADLSGDDTKINYKDGSGYEWAGGEKIAVVNVNNDDVLVDIKPSDGVSEDTQNAQFSVTVADGSYIAVHPETVGLEDGKLKFEFLANQRQTSGGETYSTIYDGSKRIPLVSQTKFSLDSEHQVVSQKFNPVGALIRFSIYGGDEGEQIRSVSVVAPAGTAIAGTVLYTCSFVDDALTVTPDSYSNTTNKVRVLVHEDAHKAGAADAPSIFATIIPANFQPTYIVETLDKVYTFASAKTKNFEASNRYDVKLNLTKATSVAENSKVPQQLFVVGDGTEAGWEEPKNGIEMTRSTEGDKIVFTKDLIMFDGEAYRFLCTNLSTFDDGYYNKDNNGELTFSKDSPASGQDFTVEEGNGWYTLTVTFENTSATTASLEVTRHAPIFVGANCNSSWDTSTALQMDQVDGCPGVFYLDDVIFTTNGENATNNFKFLARRDYSDYQYLSTLDNEQFAKTKWFKKDFVKFDTYFRKENGVDSKWNVGYYDCGDKCATIIVLDTKEDCVYCLPQLCLIGGAGGGFFAWHDANWDMPITETNYNRHKLTLDYANKCLSVTKSEVWNNNLDFKICSRNTNSWNYNEGIWLRYNADPAANYEFKWDATEASVDIRGENEADSKWFINTSSQTRYNVTLRLGIEEWATENWKLKMIGY